VPITPALALALKKAKGNRPNDATLLLKRDGTAWQQTSTVGHRDLFRRAVEQSDLNPGVDHLLRVATFIDCSRACWVAFRSPVAGTTARHVGARNRGNTYAAYIPRSLRCALAREPCSILVPLMPSCIWSKDRLSRRPSQPQTTT